MNSECERSDYDHIPGLYSRYLRYVYKSNIIVKGNVNIYTTN